MQQWDESTSFNYYHTRSTHLTHTWQQTEQCGQTQNCLRDSQTSHGLEDSGLLTLGICTADGKGRGSPQLPLTLLAAVSCREKSRKDLRRGVLASTWLTFWTWIWNSPGWCRTYSRPNGTKSWLSQADIISSGSRVAVNVVLPLSLQVDNQCEQLGASESCTPKAMPATTSAWPWAHDFGPVVLLLIRVMTNTVTLTGNISW